MRKRTVLMAILLSICLISSLTFLLLLNQKAMWEEQYQVFYMDSDSMEPALQRGDILVVDKKVNPAQLIAASKDASIPGDIIAFHHPRYEKDADHIIVHRAVEKNQLDGTWYFHTKGDANFGMDPWILPQDCIVGKVVDINPSVIVVYWNLWLWLTAAVAAGTGVSSLMIFLLSPRKKKKAIPSPPLPLSSVETKQITPTTPQTNVIHCIYCGEELPPVAVYCRKCGKKVTPFLL